MGTPEQDLHAYLSEQSAQEAAEEAGWDWVDQKWADGAHIQIVLFSNVKGRKLWQWVLVDTDGKDIADGSADYHSPTDAARDAEIMADKCLFKMAEEHLLSTKED